MAEEMSTTETEDYLATTANTTAVPDDNTSNSVILVYYSVAAVILGFLLFYAIKVSFKLYFFDFFYATEDEVREMEEEKEAVEQARLKKLEGKNAKPVPLNFENEETFETPPAMLLLLENYERRKAMSAYQKGNT